MASTRSALRSRRKPSSPTSLAIVCKSASGLASSSERSSTAIRSSFFRSGWAVGVQPRWTAAGTRCDPRLATRAVCSPRRWPLRDRLFPAETLVADFLGQREIPAHVGLTGKRGTHREEVGGGGYIVHPEDVRAVLHAVSECSESARQTRTRRTACQRTDEILARYRHQQRQAQLV